VVLQDSGARHGFFVRRAFCHTPCLVKSQIQPEYKDSYNLRNACSEFFPDNGNGKFFQVHYAILSDV
jgi:hypothetical protein